MFSEFREERLRGEKQAHDEFLQRQREDALRKQQAEAAQAAAFQKELADSREFISRFYTVVGMAERVMYQYCEAVFGKMFNYKTEYSFVYRNLRSDGTVDDDQKKNNLQMRYANQFSPADINKLIRCLRADDHYGVDALVVKNRGILRFQPLHSREYQVVLKSVEFSVVRGWTIVNDIFSDCGGSTSSDETIHIVVTAEGITVMFKGTSPEMQFSVQTEAELVEKLTVIEQEYRASHFRSTED